MNKFILRLVFCVVSLLFCAISFAQDNSGAEGIMRSNGKIYVVVAVCLTILVGLFFYVFSLDRKISRMEKGKD